MKKLTLTLSDADAGRIEFAATKHTRGNKTELVRLAVDRLLEPPTTAAARYEALVRDQYRELRRLLSEDELIVIANAIRGWHIEPADPPLLWMEVADYLEMATEELIQLAPVDGPALVDKLLALTGLQAHALVWALQQAMERAGAGDHTSITTALGGQLRGAGSN